MDRVVDLMGKRKTEFLVPTFLIVMSVLPFIWYKDALFHSYLYVGKMDPSVYYSIWYPGYGGFLNQPPVLRYFFVYFLERFLPVSIESKILFTIPVLIASLSMYYLLRFLHLSKLSSAVGAVFYIYSINGQALSYANPEFALGWALLPAIMALWLDIPKSGASLFLRGVVVGLMFLAMSPQNLTIIALYIILAVLVIFFNTIVRKGQLFPSIKLIFISFLALIALALPLYVGQVFQLLLGLQRITYLLSLETPQWLNSYSTIVETLRLMGSVSMYYFFPGYGLTAPQFAPFINDSLFRFVSLIFPVLAGMGLLSHKRKKDVLFFGVVLVVAIFFSVGGNSSSPTASIYMWLYSHIPFFNIFRDSYKAVMLINLCYSVLLGVLCEYTTKLFRRHLHSNVYKVASLLMIASIIISIGFISYQYWGGSFLANQTFSLPSYWKSFSKDINTFGDTRILLLPRMDFPSYTWISNPGNHPEFYLGLTDNRAMALASASASHNYFILNETYFSLSNGDTETLLLDLFIMNVKYVVVQYDTNWKLYGESMSPAMASSLLNQLRFTKVGDYGLLEAFAVPYSEPPQHIFALRASSCILAHENELLITDIKCVYDNLLPVSFEKVAPYSYIIKNDLTMPHWLVFSESYDRGWLLYCNKVTLPLASVGVPAVHYILNNFSNAWFIQNNNSCDSFTIFYWPQTVFYFTVLLSWLITPIALLITYRYFKKVEHMASQKDVSPPYSEISIDRYAS